MAIKQGMLREHHWTLFSGEDRLKESVSDGAAVDLVFSYEKLNITGSRTYPIRTRIFEYRVASNEEIAEIVGIVPFKIHYARMEGYSYQFLKSRFPIPDDINGNYATYAGKRVELKAWTTDRKGIRVCRKKPLNKDLPIDHAIEEAFAWARKYAPAATAEKTLQHTSRIVNHILTTASNEALKEFRDHVEIWQLNANGNGTNPALTINGCDFSSPDVLEVVFSTHPTSEFILATIKMISSEITTAITTINIETKIDVPESIIDGMAGSDLASVVDEKWAKGLRIDSAKKKTITKRDLAETMTSITAKAPQEVLQIPEKGISIDHRAKYQHVMTSLISQKFLFREDVIALLKTSSDEQRCALACAMANMRNGTLYVSEKGLRGWNLKLNSKIFSVEMAPLLANPDDIREALGIKGKP